MKLFFVSSNLASTVQVGKQPTTFPSLSEGKYILQKNYRSLKLKFREGYSSTPMKEGLFLIFLFQSFFNLALTKEATREVGGQS